MNIITTSLTVEDKEFTVSFDYASRGPAGPAGSAPVETSKTLTYSGGRLQTLSDSYGSKAFSYDASGNLVGIVGTGNYQSKTFNYTAGVLTSITVL